MHFLPNVKRILGFYTLPSPQNSIGFVKVLSCTYHTIKARCYRAFTKIGVEPNDNGDDLTKTGFYEFNFDALLIDPHLLNSREQNKK